MYGMHEVHEAWVKARGIGNGEILIFADPGASYRLLRLANIDFLRVRYSQFEY